MRRLLAIIVIVCILAPVAEAVVWSYNPSYGQPTRTVSVSYSGWNIIRTVTVTDGRCTTTTTTYYAFWIQTGETVTTECR